MATRVKILIDQMASTRSGPMILVLEQLHVHDSFHTERLETLGVAAHALQDCILYSALLGTRQDSKSVLEAVVLYWSYYGETLSMTFSKRRTSFYLQGLHLLLQLVTAPKGMLLDG